MPDVFPSDLLGEIRALQKRVDDLEAQAKNRPGMSEASGGWILRGMPSPNTAGLGSGDVHIFARGARLVARTQSGLEIQLLPIPVAGHVSSVVNSDADSTYSSNEQLLINELKTTVNAILTQMQLAGQMA